MAKVYLAVYNHSDGWTYDSRIVLSVHQSEEGAALAIDNRHMKTMDPVFKDQLAYPVDECSDFEIEPMELED